MSFLRPLPPHLRDCPRHNHKSMRTKDNLKIKPVPFRIDRNRKANLSEQVAEGFRQSILSRYYKAGDVLPSRGEIAAALGISERIPREAISILARESYVCPRRGIGCTVLAPGEIVWKGRVLIVQRIGCEGSYCNAMLISELRRRLAKAGYLFSCVTLDQTRKGGNYDMLPVVEALRQPTDLVLAVYPTVQIARFLDGRCSYLCFGGEGAKEHTIQTSASCVAHDQLFRHCRALGVRRILFSGYGNYGPELASFQSAGFEVEDMPVWPPNKGIGYLEEIERTAMEAFRVRFAAGKRRPDLVYFADDYIARGGLTALLSLAVRVPEDVKVVTFANRGFVPVFPISLARIEEDPVAVGRCAAEAVVARLEGRSAQIEMVGERFVPGESCR